MKSVTVDTETKVVKTKISREIVEDLKFYHSIDTVTEITALLEAELKSEFASNIKKMYSESETFIPETREEMIIDMFNKVLYEGESEVENNSVPISGMDVFESFKIPLIRNYGGRSLGHYDDEENK